MSKLVQEKDNEISELKKHSQYLEAEMMDKESTMNDLRREVKDVAEEKLAATRNVVELKDKLANMAKEKEILEASRNTSREEVAQLLYLNQQLKNSNVQLLHSSNGNSSSMTAEECTQSPQYEEANNTGERSREGEEAINQKWCYSEVRQAGSCKNGRKCNFVHDIPHGHINKETVLNSIGNRNLCINEYRKENSCMKGANCRFHHNISEEQRRDPKIQDIMKRKMERMNIHVKERRDENNNDNPPICVFEFEEVGGCRRRNKCLFRHEIKENERNNSNIRDEINTRRERLSKTRENQEGNTYTTNKEMKINNPLQLLEQMYRLMEHAHF